MVKKKKAPQWLWPAAVLAVAAILSVAVYFGRLEQYKSWLPAPGVVQRVELYSGGKHHSGGHRIYFSFAVNGKEYRGSTSYSGRHSDFHQGDDVEVWYDPEDPTRSSFHKPSPGLDPIGPLFFGVGIVLMIIMRRRYV